MAQIRVFICSMRHKPIIIFGAVAFIVSALFPPWVFTINLPNAGPTERPGGYHLIFDPPPAYKSASAGVRIDYARLLIQWAVIGIVVAGAVSIRRKE